MSRLLRIGLWNINGPNSSVLGNKLRADEFTDIVNKHDIFAILETHATNNADLNVSNFKHFIKYRNKSENARAFGGISIYINLKLSEEITYVSTENENIIWCKLDKTHFSLAKDIYLGTVYLSPCNSERRTSEDLIGQMDLEMLHFLQKGDVIV